MHPHQGTTPTRVSNEEFVAGALYPGGRGLVKSCRYQLHDYNGKQAKDSNCGLFITFQPTDGSNEGKPVELFWNVGPSSEFIPDVGSQGGFILSLHGRTGISDSSNCSKYLINKLKSTCGLPKGKLDEGNGVHVLEGSEIMFAQQDQEDRDFQDRQPGQAAGQAGRKNKVYVPTYAKFAWESGAGRGNVATMPNPIAQAPAQGQAPAAPHSNGTPANGISPDLAAIIKGIGAIGLTDPSNPPAKSVLDYTVANNINNPQRMALVKEATALFKDPNLEVIAAANGWSVSGGMLMAG